MEHYYSLFISLGILRKNKQYNDGKHCLQTELVLRCVRLARQWNRCATETGEVLRDWVEIFRNFLPGILNPKSQRVYLIYFQKSSVWIISLPFRNVRGPFFVDDLPSATGIGFLGRTYQELNLVGTEEKKTAVGWPALVFAGWWPWFLVTAAHKNNKWYIRLESRVLFWRANYLVCWWINGIWHALVSFQGCKLHPHQSYSCFFGMRADKGISLLLQAAGFHLPDVFLFFYLVKAVSHDFMS